MSLSLHNAAIVVSFVLLLFLINCYSRYLRLKHIPGPFLASFTDFWRVYHQNVGTLSAETHTKYGQIVRVGPNTVLISDATAIPAIYTNHGEFQKADTYGPMRVPTALGRSVGSVLDMQDESQNTALKRGVGSAFTAKAVLAYENDCNATAHELIQTIKAYPTFDLFPTLQFFQLDFLTRMAFSENYGHLKQRKDVWGMAGPTKHRVVHWVQWQGASKMEYFLYQHPFWCKFWKIPQSSDWVKTALGQLNSRRNANIDLPTFTTPKTDLLQKFVEAAVKRPDIKPETIALMTTSTIGAGFDTTAHGLTSIIYLLVKHPRILEKLRDELANTHQTQPIPLWDEVNKLAYLDAIWKESTRYNPFLNIPLERIVPATGLEICGKSIPPGTIIGAQAFVVHRDPNVFGTRYAVDEFRPERWIEASDEERLAMERGSLGFGSGKRVCLGRHIAEMEIKKVIPALVQGFDMSLVDENASLKSGDGLANFPGVLIVRFRDRTNGAWEKSVM